MSIIPGVLVAIITAMILFIGMNPEEWIRWVILWTCVFIVFLAIYAVIILMGVKLI